MEFSANNPRAANAGVPYGAPFGFLGVSLLATLNGAWIPGCVSVGAIMCCRASLASILHWHPTYQVHRSVPRTVWQVGQGSYNGYGSGGVGYYGSTDPGS